MYDMDMRDYDPAIGRWVVQDPVVHFSHSPYSAFDNNPVFYADPSGSDSESFIMDLFNNSASGTTWTNNDDGTFSDGNGNSVHCERCKELNKRKAKLESELKKINEVIVRKSKYVNITRDLTSNGATANILKEYIIAYEKLSDEQIEYLINNPGELETHVLTYIVNYEIDLGLGDLIINNETRQKSQEDANNEILGKLSGLSDRIVLLANLTNIYINSATKIMHKAAQASHASSSIDKAKTKKELSKINQELKELSH